MDEKLIKLQAAMLKAWRLFLKAAEAYRVALVEAKVKEPYSSNLKEFVGNFARREEFYGHKPEDSRKPYSRSQ